MIALFLLVIIAAVALGVIGMVINGLFYLLIIGIVIFLIDFLFLGFSLRRRGPAR